MRIPFSIRYSLAAPLVVALTVWTAGCSKPKPASPTASAEERPIAQKSITLSSDEATNPAGSAPQASGSGEWTALDVAGVRLGMTPEQAIAALSGFDSHLSLSKHHATGPNATYGESEPDECTNNEPFRIFAGILAAEGTTFQGGVKKEDQVFHLAHYVGCGDDSKLLPGDEPQLVSIQPSPQPGQHRVIGVSLWKSFKAPPTVEAIVAGALKKYPPAFTAKEVSSGDSRYHWCYDTRGRLMSKMPQRDMPGAISAEPSSAFPSYVYEGSGVGLTLVVESDSKNPALAKQFRVSLYDEDALYRFIGAAKGMYEAFHKKQLDDETDKARKSAAPVKM